MAKVQLRSELLARRSTRTPEAVEAAGQALASHAAGLPAVAGAKRIAAYLAMTSEPPTSMLIDGALARNCEVIVPVTQADGSMDWVLWEPGTRTRRSRLGMDEPDADPIGSRALETCDLVFVPALAIDHRGCRLGRGGGFYDRALAETCVPIAALVFDDEIVPELPGESHDVPVDAAICPQGVFRILR